MVEFYHQIKQTVVTKTNITYESKQKLFYDLFQLERVLKKFPEKTVIEELCKIAVFFVRIYK